MKLKAEIAQHKKKHPEDIKSGVVMAFVVRRGKVVAVGYNRRKFPSGGVFSCHAEEAAIKKAGRRAVNATMIVVRLKKDESFGLAYPCEDCREKISRAGIGRIKYSTEGWNGSSPVG